MAVWLITACCPAADSLYASIDGDRSPVPPTRPLDPFALPQHPSAFANRAGLIAPDFDPAPVDRLSLNQSREFLQHHAQRRPDKPFFLLHSTHAMHRPSLAAEQSQGRTQAAPHGDLIPELDFIADELLQTLERLDLADNPAVMFSSDNGPATTSVAHLRADYDHDSARPWCSVERDPWEGGHRVPCLIRWPRTIPPGRATDQTVCLADVLATCAAIAGAALPTHAAEDSFNLLPVLLGTDRGTPVRPSPLHPTIRLALRQGPWTHLDHRGSGGNHHAPGERQPWARPDPAPAAPGPL